MGLKPLFGFASGPLVKTNGKVKPTVKKIYLTAVYIFSYTTYVYTVAFGKDNFADFVKKVFKYFGDWGKNYSGGYSPTSPLLILQS